MVDALKLYTLCRVSLTVWINDSDTGDSLFTQYQIYIFLAYAKFSVIINLDHWVDVKRTNVRMVTNTKNRQKKII